MATEQMSPGAFPLATSLEVIESIEHNGTHEEWVDPMGAAVITDSFAVNSQFNVSRADNKTGFRQLEDILRNLSGNPDVLPHRASGAVLTIQMPTDHNSADKRYAVYDARQGSGVKYAVECASDGQTIVTRVGRMSKDTLVDVPEGAILTLHQIIPPVAQHGHNVAISNTVSLAQYTYERITTAIDASKVSKLRFLLRSFLPRPAEPINQPNKKAAADSIIV